MAIIAPTPRRFSRLASGVYIRKIVANQWLSVCRVGRVWIALKIYLSTPPSAEHCRFCARADARRHACYPTRAKAIAAYYGGSK